jgi:hypothetical protein
MVQVKLAIGVGRRMAGESHDQLAMVPDDHED